MSRFKAFLFVFVGAFSLIGTQPVQAACPAQEINCGRILNADVKKKGVQKIYQHCGTHQVRTSRGWAFGKCKLNERPKAYAELCRTHFPDCGCPTQKKKNQFRSCTALDYYYEIKP